MNKRLLVIAVLLMAVIHQVTAQLLPDTTILVEGLPQHHFPSSVPPGNYSGITPLGNNRYAVVDDKAATSGFHVFTMMVDSVSGELSDVRHEGFRSSAIPNRDEEGIAFFTPDSTLFISGEHDNAVLEYSLAGQLTGRHLDIPTVIRQAHANQGLEALTYHSASHHFWTVTEAPLAGETSQRLLQFSDSLTCSGQWRYVMDAPQTNKRRGTDVYGVSALTALPDGRLLVLEREFFVAQHYIGSFVTCRLFLIDPLHTAEDAVLPKQLLYSWTTRLNLTTQHIANYEGMCLGPRLPDGRQVLILVADSQNQYKGVLKDWFKTLLLSD